MAKNAGVLASYFELLDERRTDDLVELFVEDGLMITRGGTEGLAVQGHVALRSYYSGRGPSTVRHILTASSQSASASMAEGLVRPRTNGAQNKFFIASASLDQRGRITRYTTLVWPDITSEQAGWLVGRATAGAGS